MPYGNIMAGSTTPEKYASHFTGQEQKLGKLAVFVQARFKEA